MSDFIYYRGSSTYEDAVKNRLDALEATGVATTHAISNLGSELRSGFSSTTNAIQAHTNAIQDMVLGMQSYIRESTYMNVASQVMLAQKFEQGFNELNNTLNVGFGILSYQLESMTDKICSKLDEIHDIVNNPRLTACRELFRCAEKNYNKKYYEEALEDCKAALEKDKTDPLSWTLLGKIYLFGAGKFSYMIDEDKAEEAFFNAAKYIDADIDSSIEANQQASGIYCLLGLTHLIKSNNYLLENKIDESKAELIEAEKASGTSYKLFPGNLVAGYEQAKELHFLERDKESLKLLEKIIRADKNYALKACNDKNFESLWEQIDALILRLRDELADEITKKCNPFHDSTKTKIEELQKQFKGVICPSKNQYETQDEALRKFWYKEFGGNELQRNKFNSLAREIGLQRNHYNDSSETYIPIEKYLNDFKWIEYRDTKTIGAGSLSISFYDETVKKKKSEKWQQYEEGLELKEQLDKALPFIEKKLIPFASVYKEDYYSVVEKYNCLDATIAECNEFFQICPSEFEMRQKLKNFCETTKNIQDYFDAKKEWETKKREEEEKKEEEERRRRLIEEEERRQRLIEEENRRKKHKKYYRIVGLLILLVVILFIGKGIPAWIDYTHSEPYQTEKLFEAINDSNLQQVRLCIEAGADINGKLDEVTKYTPLIYAVVKGSRASVDLLIKSGADLNQKDSSDVTALGRALALGRQDIITLLQEAGATE